VQVGAYSSQAVYSLPATGVGARPRTADGQGGAVDSSAATGELSADDERTVARLRETDRAVRQHEQAHIAAGAGLVTGGPSFTYTTGPDGKRYAVGGEVSIDTSPARSPEATIAKARQIRAAALAPADPSGQDRRVAVAAARMEAEARAEGLAGDKQKEGDSGAGASGKLPPAGEAASSGYEAVATAGLTVRGGRIDAFA